ncbi:MAG TPA: hypothetical protein VJS12_06645 [Steroidobacteraceae bacterium]|nr:hypothetical protein [Steroidobacteraceae bacterium]
MQLVQCLQGAAATALLQLFVCPPVGAEPFIGQFELKDLESAPASFEFQSQNAWSWGLPRRRIASDADGVEYDENESIRERYALELEMGLTSILKMRVGMEFEKERFDEPVTVQQANAFDQLRLSEVGAELIAVLVPREGDGAGFGLVAELEGPLDQEDSNTLVLGAIIEFQSARWRAAAVPMLVRDFGGDTQDGERVDNKWDFAYAAQLAFEISATWSLALEGYGTVERLGSTGHPSDAAELFGDFNQHRLGPVLYYSSSAGERAASPILSVGAGLLAGLNNDTADRTLKLSIEVNF